MNFPLMIILCEIFMISQTATLSSEERKEFLNLHNYLRRSVVPPAADMQELVYDEDIETDVNGYLEQCKFEHRKHDGYGENGRLSTDVNITNTVTSWFQEKIYFDISSHDQNRCSMNNTSYDYLPAAQCGHYNMMVKSTLKSLGCGYKLCKNVVANGISHSNVYITFCFYDSGQKYQPYQVGEACSACEMNYQFCHKNLCVPRSRYDISLTSCHIKCLNCGSRFDPNNSCLCDCPDGTDENNCRGMPLYQQFSCSTCQVQGLSCNNGSEISKNGKCICKCPENYKGEYCDVRNDQSKASYHCLIDGPLWRHNMRMPIDVIEFKKLFPTLQQIVAADVAHFCSRNNNSKFDCQNIDESSMSFKNVHLIPNSLMLHRNGSISFQLFLNNIQELGGTINERFVTPSLLSEIWNKRSTKLNELIKDIQEIGSKRDDTSKPASIIQESNEQNEQNKAKVNFLFSDLTNSTEGPTSWTEYNHTEESSDNSTSLPSTNPTTTKKSANRTIISETGLLFLSWLYTLFFK